jgi:hypothetical protein
MAEPNSGPAPQDSRRNSTPRIQFSLARLMIGMTVVAVLLGVVTTIPGIYDSLFIFAPAAALVACSVYARGDYQAFAIGALIPWVAVLIPPAIHWQNETAGLGFFFHLLFSGGICGGVAVLTRRWIYENGLN